MTMSTLSSEKRTRIGNERRAPDAAHSLGIHVPGSRPMFSVICTSMSPRETLLVFGFSLMTPACLSRTLSVRFRFRIRARARVRVRVGVRVRVRVRVS